MLWDMDTISAQEQTFRVLLRVCTGKKDQSDAKRIAHELDDQSAQIVMSYLSRYTTPEYILLSKTISDHLTYRTFTPNALRALSAVVPVLTAFSVDDEEAVLYLRSLVRTFDHSLIRKSDPELIARAVMVGFIVKNPETQNRDHLRWVGEKAEELGACADLLKIRRNIDRSTCDLALAGVPFTAPMQSGIL